MRQISLRQRRAIRTVRLSIPFRIAAEMAQAFCGSTALRTARVPTRVVSALDGGNRTTRRWRSRCAGSAGTASRGRVAVIVPPPAASRTAIVRAVGMRCLVRRRGGRGGLTRTPGVRLQSRLIRALGMLADDRLEHAAHFRARSTGWCRSCHTGPHRSRTCDRGFSGRVCHGLVLLYVVVGVV